MEKYTFLNMIRKNYFQYLSGQLVETDVKSDSYF
jgi:hypothetical protein